MTNPGFVLLAVSYGINVGVFYAMSTLLNQTVLFHFPVNNSVIISPFSTAGDLHF